MAFQSEADFESSLIKVLVDNGWEKTILKNSTEQDLLKNWANILFENNRQRDRLNNYPLTDSEMQQILEKINMLKTPLSLNSFINGKTISITRDNLEDKEHHGKEISLKIYDRQEIAAGQSRYQIVEQPIFSTKSPILNNRRGDLSLLINGMPVIHIELKKSGIPVSQAYNQIEKYSKEHVFTGLFSLIQIFVSMTPEETVYFANPGPEGRFNPDYYFHWADFNNKPMNDWKQVASHLLNIPIAHQLIGFYTVADNSDGILKVMRSYQYYAANAISDRVSKIRWGENNQRGGYVWHTTGSGKTMTSFKSAQLISTSGDADKVVFLTDRIELGIQSLKEYRGFADDRQSVQATENTKVLISKLKSSNPEDTLIVTSIQKMSNIEEDAENQNIAHDIEIMNRKRIVFIIDEAHRDVFGEMLCTIKKTFPNAIFFGFTGTPIFPENSKKMNSQTDVFGDELHRYSIADGIRDKNVLGFDPYMVLTFKDNDIRTQVALEKAKATSVEEALGDPNKRKTFQFFMDKTKIPMSGTDKTKGIEDYLPITQYDTDEHRKMVIEDIAENWLTLSHDGKFHALFATSSIIDAIIYYRLLRKRLGNLKITCLFDPTIDNNGGVEFKETGLVEILEDYNRMYHKNFSIPTYAAFKKDVAMRLAHKEQYKTISKESEKEKQLDLLIVVDQMLTGFDSKWLNTLYLDKVLYYENIIQAFSRTNRLFGPDKPFGTIRYYRMPHTMANNIEVAIKRYSGDKPYGLFVEKLPNNIDHMNSIFSEIKELFTNAGIPDFQKLPQSDSEKAKFAVLFKKLNGFLEAAKIQGFKWEQREYHFPEENTEKIINFNDQIYAILALRYKELPDVTSGTHGKSLSDLPYDIEGYLTQIDTGIIDAEYMNSRFKKYIKLLMSDDPDPSQKIEVALDDLHKSFATLTQEEQKYANIFLHDIQSGNIYPDCASETFRDYITDYICKAKHDQVHHLSKQLGLDENMLREMMERHITETNLNEFGRFEKLKETVDKEKAKVYFESLDGPIPKHKVNMKVDKLLKNFILSGGFEIAAPSKAPKNTSKSVFSTQ